MRSDVNNADKPSNDRPRRRQRSVGQALKGSAPGVLNLRIDKVVLHGFEPNDRIRIGQAMQRELTRLFREQGVPPSLMQGHVIERLDGGSLQMAPGAKSSSIGSQIAQAVYGGLVR
jgi:hypothetical protein